MSPSSFRTSSIVEQPLFPVEIILPEITQAVSPLIDSGVDANIIDEELAGNRAATYMPLNIRISGDHHETVQLHVLPSPRSSLILGFPWLRRHNPHIDSSAGIIRGWGPSCW